MTENVFLNLLEVSTGKKIKSMEHIKCHIILQKINMTIEVVLLLYVFL